mgnify:CR=1 FL=1
MLRFHFPIVIIDEDFRSENTSGLGIRALAANATGRVEARQRGRTYHYRIQAYNVVGNSEWVTLAVTVP